MENKLLLIKSLMADYLLKIDELLLTEIFSKLKFWEMVSFALNFRIFFYNLLKCKSQSDSINVIMYLRA